MIVNHYDKDLFWHLGFSLIDFSYSVLTVMHDLKLCIVGETFRDNVGSEVSVFAQFSVLVLVISCFLKPDFVIV